MKYFLKEPKSNHRENYGRHMVFSLLLWYKPTARVWANPAETLGNVSDLWILKSSIFKLLKVNN